MQLIRPQDRLGQLRRRSARGRKQLRTDRRIQYVEQDRFQRPILRCRRGMADEAADQRLRDPAVNPVHAHMIPVIQSEAASHKVNSTDYTGGTPVRLDYIEYFDAVVSSLPDEYKSDECRIIISKTDHERYIKQIGQVDGGLAYERFSARV